MPRSPNPWCPDGSPLPESDSEIDAEETLDVIRQFLRSWPGEPTVLVSEEERHKRLIRTIAGYPKLRSYGKEGLDTTPLDRPLTYEASRCFKMLISLDSRAANKPSTRKGPSSLWTEILEYEFRNSSGEFNIQRTNVVLALLFNGLDQEHEDLSRAAQSLLAEMFSYHNWGLSKWTRVRKAMKNPSIPAMYHDESHATRTYEVRRIKNWVDEVVIKREGGEGMQQAYMRGASALVGALTSSRRDELESRNYAGVVIDGGGRLTFRTDGNHETAPNLEVEDQVNAHFGTDIGPSLNEILPRLNVYEGDEPIDVPPASPEELKRGVERLLSQNDPTPPRKTPPWAEGCPRCDPSVEINRGSEGSACVYHAAIKDIGNNQRKRDSSLRQPSKNHTNPSLPPAQRTVVAVSRIDGNSIGWALSAKRFPDFLRTLDMVKRRSMRFNAHWWSALSESLLEDSQESPDRIACWVSAGDDIILGEYAATNERRPEDDGKASLDLMEKLSSKLEGTINAELAPNSIGPLVTFCASISIRGSIPQDSISKMLQRSKDLESHAKESWKQSHSSLSGGRVMISEEKLSRDSPTIERRIIPRASVSSEGIAEQMGIGVEAESDIAMLHEAISRAEWVEAHGERALLIPGRGTVPADPPGHASHEIPANAGSIEHSIILSEQR